MAELSEWWSAGERLMLRLGQSERGVFLARSGAGPATTLLHGFPSSSYDWAGVAGALSASRSLLMPDFLGFGASDKPAPHLYSIHEQADLVERVWEHEQVMSTALVAHDYGVSVAQELLARRAGGLLPVELESVHFLNGGVYPDLHRPQPLQSALLDPEQGPKISALVTEELFVTGLQPTFAPGFSSGPAAADIWRSMSRDGGERIGHLLIRYIADREQHGRRWIDALETAELPIGFIWGMLDPVSGAHMAARITERLPQAPFVALEDVGHWPPLEAAGRVATALTGH